MLICGKLVSSSSCFVLAPQDMPFLSEPTVGEVERVFAQSKGTKTPWQVAEEVRRRQMEGQEPFMARYAQETPQERQAKQQAADAAMKKLLGDLL